MSEIMKILSFAQVDMSKTDACVVHTIDLARGFRQAGVKTDVIVISSQASVVKEEGLTVYVLPKWITPWFIEGIVCNIIAWFILLLKGRRYDRIYIRHHSNLAMALRFFPWRIPIWLEVNAIFSIEEVYRKKSRGAWIRECSGPFLERLAFGRAERIFCVTPQLTEHIKRIFPKVIRKLVAVSNGVDITHYQPIDKSWCRRWLGLDENVRYIGFIGNFVAWLGIDTVLNALPLIMKKYEDVKAILVGDGEYFNDYVSLAENLGIKDRVIFPGRVHKDDAPLWINTFDIGMVLSRLKEHGDFGHSPLKLYAYMSCGIPVIATDGPGFDIVQRYQSGILVPYKDDVKLQRVIEQLLNDEKLRIEYGKNGRKCVEELFSWKIIAQRVVNLAN